jgi:hypothetical protein
MPNTLSLNELFVQDSELSKSSGFAINLFSLSDIKGKKIYVYGYGRGYITLKAFLLDKYKIPVHAVLDIKFNNLTNIGNENFIDPSNFSIGEEDSKNSVIIISIGCPSVQNDLFLKLADIGFKNIITAFQIYEYHLSHEDVNFSQNPVQRLLKDEDKINTAYQLLADNKSKRIFKVLLQVYAGLKTSLIESDSINRQYFPDDITLVKGKSRFIN